MACKSTLPLWCLLVSLSVLSTDALSSTELAEFIARTHTESNTNLQGTVTIDTTSDANNYIISSNGIPDHNTGTFPGTGNPNNIRTQSFRFNVPKTPAKASSTSCLTFGPIAVSKNGIPIFNPNNINGENAVEGPNAEVFDSCDGHPDMMGVYHYHQTPDCLYKGGNDEFIGVALDGFPIYGIKDSTGKELTTSDLDSCHGHEYNGNYVYRLTREYPYILGCFTGTKASQGGRSPPEDCLSGSPSLYYQSLASFLIPLLTSIFIQSFMNRI